VSFGGVSFGGVSFGGRREVGLCLGHCVLRAALEAGEPAEPGPCRVSINPAAMQVWYTEAGDVKERYQTE
jgi:hypothetical protein